MFFVDVALLISIYKSQSEQQDAHNAHSITAPPYSFLKIESNLPAHVSSRHLSNLAPS